MPFWRVPFGHFQKPEKYPEKDRFWYFFGIFGVFSWGSQISVGGVFFRYFSWKFWVGPSRGSVAGRGVLKRGFAFHLTKHNKPSNPSRRFSAQIFGQFIFLSNTREQSVQSESTYFHPKFRPESQNLAFETQCLQFLHSDNFR